MGWGIGKADGRARQPTEMTCDCRLFVATTASQTTTSIVTRETSMMEGRNWEVVGFRKGSKATATGEGDSGGRTGAIELKNPSSRFEEGSKKTNQA